MSVPTVAAQVVLPDVRVIVRPMYVVAPGFLNHSVAVAIPSESVIDALIVTRFALDGQYPPGSA